MASYDAKSSIWQTRPSEVRGLLGRPRLAGVREVPTLTAAPRAAPAPAPACAGPRVKHHDAAAQVEFER